MKYALFSVALVAGTSLNAFDDQAFKKAVEKTEIADVMYMLSAQPTLSKEDKETLLQIAQKRVEQTHDAFNSTFNLKTLIGSGLITVAVVSTILDILKADPFREHPRKELWLQDMQQAPEIKSRVHWIINNALISRGLLGLTGGYFLVKGIANKRARESHKNALGIQALLEKYSPAA